MAIQSLKVPKQMIYLYLILKMLVTTTDALGHI